MIRRSAVLIASLSAAALLWAPSFAGAQAENCETEPRPECFGIESVAVSPSTTQAGAHPDLEFDVAITQNPNSPLNVYGLHDSYAATRNIRFVVPPGLIGDPNAIGAVQQCSAQQLVSYNQPGGGCPNGSQIGVSNIATYELLTEFHEPVYMMKPPGGDVVARLGLIAGIFPTFLDFRVRSDSDYGLVAEVTDASAQARVLKLETTLWGVPAAKEHDEERCTAIEAFVGTSNCGSRPPGGNELPFFTNPTRCGVPLSASVNASSWAEPQMKPEGEVKATFPAITGCDKLPFGPGVEVDTTSHHTSAPTGLDMTIKLPASPGVKVLEPSQMRYMRIDLPPGLTVNPAAADGLQVCSPQQVRFHENVASECPDGSKLGATEFDIPVLERKVKGSIYLREPEPGHPYRIWVVADDLGLHVKLPGDLELDQKTGQIHSVIIGTPETEGIPQAPLREVKLLLKSGFRAPMVTPEHCGTYYTHFEFIPWSGGPPATGNSPMKIDEGCATGGFAPKIAAGSTDAQGGAYSPFNVTITREDGEQNLAGLNALTLPTGLAASFAGIPHCEGQAAVTGQCPAASKIGRVAAAIGPGPTPLWVPQPGKRPTAVYLGGPYKGAPTSIVAVVPKQAGPFDFGDEVVRSAVYVNPVTAQATAKADPFPQILEGIPITYRDVSVQLDRPHFIVNPTSCAKKETTAALSSTLGAGATPSATYAATDCGTLGFKPRFSLKLKGGTKRGKFPALDASFRPRAGDANASTTIVRLPHSAFLEQGHFRTICTRVQYNANGGGGAGCPAASIYGHVTATSPLLEGALEGPVFLRSSNHNLPDMVLSLHGPPSLPIQIEAVGRIDSKEGGIRSSFEGIPDAPITEVRLEMEGGAKGLIVNSTDLCASTNRAEVDLGAHNGKSEVLHPAVGTSCKKKAHKAKKHRSHGHRRKGR
jgi:hypothetical protein